MRDFSKLNSRRVHQIFSILALMLFCISISAGQESGAIPAWQIGNSNAKYQLEIFVDYECPACVPMNEKIKFIQNKYPNDISIIYRHYPLTQIHKNSMLAAQATEVAGIYGKFWEMGDLLLSKQKNWKSKSSADSVFAEYAKELGIASEIFKENLQNEEVLRRIDLDIKRAKSLNVTAIPSVFVNGEFLDFEKLDNLEKELSLQKINKRG